MIVIAVGTAQADVDGVGRFAGDLDPVAATGLGRLRPVGAQVFTQAGDVFEDDCGLAVDESVHLESQRRGTALGDVSRGDVEVLGRLGPARVVR